jgi:hypothetical protein
VIVAVQRWLATYDKTTSSMDAKFERYHAKQRERQARAGGQNARSR